MSKLQSTSHRIPTCGSLLTGLPYVCSLGRIVRSNKDSIFRRQLHTARFGDPFCLKPQGRVQSARSTSFDPTVRQLPGRNNEHPIILCHVDPSAHEGPGDALAGARDPLPTADVLPAQSGSAHEARLWEASCPRSDRGRHPGPGAGPAGGVELCRHGSV
jgi:hypothetical protein